MPFLRLKHLEIRPSVIRLVAIGVMDDLFRRQVPAKGLLGDQAVLVHVALAVGARVVGHPDSDVAQSGSDSAVQ